MRNPTRISTLLAACLCLAAAPSALGGGSPANDLCTDAIAIDCSAGPVTVSGSTSGATFDDAGFCGTSNTAPGVWYSVSHAGLITASTCNQANFDTKISVYDGGCGALGCVAGQDDASGCSGFTSELTWGSDGSEQLILVHGFGTATGEFDLTVTCEEAAENDICLDAIGALPVGSVTAGSTTNATLDEPPDIDCGTSVTAPGVWYTVEGTGNTMTASTCNDGNPDTGSADYDSKISVYCADCEQKECIGGQDDDTANCAGFSTNFSWPTQAGATYNVLVHGFSNQTGDFDLAILDDGVPVTEGVNDCDGVAEEFDFCADTAIPESVPTAGYLAPNRFALTDGDGVFDTNAPQGKGPPVGFSLVDTAGCSCEQIIDELGVGQGHRMFGCSISVMEDWVAYLQENSCGNCVQSNAAPGCENEACETAVCSVDSFCCNVSWDGICANEAIDICSPDLCLALPPTGEVSAFDEMALTLFPVVGPFTKDPAYVPPSKEE